MFELLALLAHLLKLFAEQFLLVLFNGATNQPLITMQQVYAEIKYKHTYTGSMKQSGRDGRAFHSTILREKPCTGKR